MASCFDARQDSRVQRRAMRAYVEVLLKHALEPMQLAARGCGYALAVHGSLARDIDLVAIPWVENAQEPKVLVDRLCGVIAGVLGRAHPSADWTDKPHGRRAVLILTTGDAEIDLSIMPKVSKGDDP